ncbi:Hypothetical protein, putative [Bodo saltans]|uniref:Uncharacterized protein n=1 Tax=Bodo saltans TaxID=75058 RepID=A0A0S4IMB4_BODSA|nr:Hypothetical protein, putative [Bodo saltans]|eukprot:CUE72149.1 Hypothetical protein, putative [Bodo saltans]
MHRMGDIGEASWAGSRTGLTSGSDDSSATAATGFTSWAATKGSVIVFLGTDAATRSATARNSSDNSYVMSVAFSPDGTLLATGSGDKRINLWCVGKAVLSATLSGYIGAVTSVAFSPNGMLLASGSSDNTTMLWRVADGTVCATLAGHTNGSANIESIDHIAHLLSFTRLPIHTHQVARPTHVHMHSAFLRSQYTSTPRTILQAILRQSQHIKDVVIYRQCGSFSRQLRVLNHTKRVVRFIRYRRRCCQRGQRHVHGVDVSAARPSRINRVHHHLQHAHTRHQQVAHSSHRQQCA